MKPHVACVAAVLGCGSFGVWLGGCGGGGAANSTDAAADSATDSGPAADASFQDSSDGGASDGGPSDGGASDGGPSDGGPSDGGPSDGGPTDGGESDGGASDGSPAAQAMKIVTTQGGLLRGSPGDALNLQVVFLLPDGGTLAVPAIQTSWLAPETVVAQNPNDPGPNSVLPEAGVKATAFFVNDEYSGQYGPGALFIVDPGTASDAGVTITASVSDAGQVSAWVSISPADGGDPTRGQNLFQNVLLADNLACADCHGTTAAGSPPIDGGEAGAMYQLPKSNGNLYTYPAPALNNTSSDAGPNLAADRSWNVGLLGMAIQADIDNQGVALRGPMPDFFQVLTNDAGATLNSQDVADIYAWLRTQTH